MKILYPLLLLFLVTAAYKPTLTGEFMLDDRPYVKENPYIRQFHSLRSYFSQEDGIVDYFRNIHSGYYRPLINLSYTLDYKIWGMKASGFRATNLIFHLLSCLLLYQLLQRFSAGRLVPFAATLLFGLHPVNTEAVAWVTSRNNILVTFFCLLSFRFYVGAWERRRVLNLLLSAVAFGIALFCKEFAVMLLPIFFLYERVYLGQKGLNKQRLKAYVPFVLLLGAYGVLRVHTTQSLLAGSATHDIFKSLYFSPFLILYDLKLIFLPYRLHSTIVRYPEGYLVWQALIGFTGLLFIAFVLWAWRRKKTVLFACLSFLLGLLPVLNIFGLSSPTLIAMRWLYFPMAFLCLGAVLPLGRALAVRRTLTLCALGAVAAYMGSYTYILNRTLWHDEARFFRQEVLNFGNLYYAGGLAEEYRRAKDYKRARPLFEKAIENAPRRAEHYINYAALLIEVKEYAAAHALLERAEPLVLTHRQRAEWYNNKGVLHEREGEPEQAVRYFAAAVELAPRQPKVWANLGTSYMKAGDLDQAVAVLEEGLRAIPKSIRLTRILAIVRFRSGDCPGSMAVIEKLPRRHRGGSTDLNALLRTCQERLARDRQDASSQGEKGLSGVTPGPSGAKNHAEQ